LKARTQRTTYSLGRALKTLQLPRTELEARGGSQGMHLKQLDIDFPQILTEKHYEQMNKFAKQKDLPAMKTQAPPPVDENYYDGLCFEA
jgi:hypothetical protein